MITAQKNKFSRGGGKYRSLLIAAAIICGAFAAQADTWNFYVDAASASPTSPYDTAATASTTIADALAAAKAKIAADGGDAIVHVASGTYTETGFELDAPIVIEGADRDGVEIEDNVAGSRAFTLSHANAAVKNLTISGNGYKTNGGEGGHVRMTAGLVSNCVIKDGRAGASAGYGNGGNVWMSGGRLERCLVTGGMANWDGWNQTESCGMGLYASGGVIDSCWFKDNKTNNSDDHNSATVYLNGAATMVNCTVTGGWARNYNSKGAGIHINNAAATVVNCVAYGNYVGKGTISSTAAANFGSANLGRYFYCAAAFPNASCATWSVLTDQDFVNYRSFTGNTEADLRSYFNSAEYAAFDWHPRLASPTVDSGTTDTAYRPADSATLDLAGNARVAGASIDLGCWECDQSQFACAGKFSSCGVLENTAITFNAVAVGPASDTVFRWDYGNGVMEDTREAAHSYTYLASGYFTVRVSASPDGGTTWTDWYTVPIRVAVAPTQMFVDSNCATPAFPYKTRSTAANTLAAAVGALTNNVSKNKTIIGGVDIVVLRGSQSNDTGIFLATAVTIRGETDNPADAEIVDNVPGNRAFTLSHPDAVVKNLTISGNGIKTDGSQGGHIWMSDGLVANCVIKDGRAAGNARGVGHGGNVYMTGGRIERCLVANGRANWGGFASANCYGMGLCATGGIIDSCFFKDNRDDNNDGRNYGSVCLDGPATMVNCTVTGGYSRYAEASGIYLNNTSSRAANAKVVNCVAYGNYGGKSSVVNTANSNFGQNYLSRFFYCGAGFDNASCATWTVLTDADFVKYESFTGTTYDQLNAYMTGADYATFNWHQKKGSAMIDAGTKNSADLPAICSALDLDGNVRLAGKSRDLGCWEVQSGLGLQIIVR